MHDEGILEDRRDVCKHYRRERIIHQEVIMEGGTDA